MLNSKWIRSKVKRIGDTAFPDFFFFLVFRKLYVLANKSRHGANTNFEILGKNNYLARDPDGLKLFFCERTRFELYIFPNGVRHRLLKIFEKYSDGEIRVKSGDVVIDVGANIGEFTVSVSHLASSIIAIDPDPNVQSSLKRNTEEISNASIYQVALSNSNGEADFFINTRDADSSLVMPQAYSEMIKVRVCSLDKLVEEAGIEKVDFLKVEAEGWEPEILSGASRTLAITQKIAVDAGPERHGEPTVEPVTKLLKHAGFNVFQRDFIIFASR